MEDSDHKPEVHGHHEPHKEHHEKPHHARETKHHEKKPASAGSDNSMSKILVGAAILQVLLLIFVSIQISNLGAVGVANEAAGAAPSPAAAPTPSAPAVVANVEELPDDDSVKGDADAPVTIVEFSDYECPFCGKFYTQTYPQLVQKYIDTGKVKLVFRDFPLSFHPNAQKAAEAAECAGEQGKYYEMHDKIFDNQQALSVTGYKQWASEIGLDTAKFNSCLDSGQMASEVQKDFQDGQAAGVRGTPAFLVNGKLISGAQPFQVFEQVIEAELAS